MGPTSPCVAFTFLPGFCIPPCVTRNESCAIGEGREFSWHGFSSSLLYNHWGSGQRSESIVIVLAWSQVCLCGGEGRDMKNGSPHQNSMFVFGGEGGRYPEFCCTTGVKPSLLQITDKEKSQISSDICLKILGRLIQLTSVQFSCSVVSDSFRPHESQHSRPPCPSPTPGVHSNSRPLSQWCHPAISSSVVLFSSCPKSFPASESFPMSQLFSWGGQSTGVSALASFLPKNTQDWWGS